MIDFSSYSLPSLSPTLISSIDELAYYGQDNEKNTLVYQDQDISRYRLKENIYEYEYDFNQYGFRDKWNIDTDKSNIAFFGCSFTFGEYIASENIFPAQVANRMPCNGFNFGLPGIGIERIAYIFSAVNRVIDLDYAVVTLPDWNRLLYLNNDNHGIRYLDLVHSSGHNGEINRIKKSIYTFGDDYFIHQSIRNINWMIDIAASHSVKLLLSSWSPPTNALIENIFPDHAIGIFPTLDRALDQAHPGTQSHTIYTKQIIQNLSIK